MDLTRLDDICIDELLADAATGSWSDHEKCGASRIKLWTCLVPTDGVCLQRYLPFLSQPERERAQRFRFERHRVEFVVARSLLRMSLGRELGCHAGELEIDYGPFGKPFLVATGSHNSIEFNLSHSNGRILMAWGYSMCIGVDVEEVRGNADFFEIAKRYFGRDEQQLLEKSPVIDRSDVFFGLWTAKEAYSKALGIGLSYPLEKVDCSKLVLKPWGYSRFARIGNGADAQNLVQYKPDANCIASIAFDKEVDEIVWRRVCCG